MKFLVVIFWALLLAVPARADLAAGEAAFDRGDFEAAYREFLPLAQAGNRKAQFWIGRLYFEGKGVPEDGRKAAKWLTRSARQGDAFAIFLLAYHYSDGWGVPKNKKKGDCLYVLAAYAGMSDAQWEFGQIVTKKSDPKAAPDPRAKYAMEMLERAARQGHREALREVGIMKASREPIELEEAIEGFTYLMIAAERGDAFAVEFLKKFRKNEQRIAKHVVNAAEQRAANWQPVQEPLLRVRPKDVRLCLPE
ncbi:MAG: tetratricopeptide repeat protein [Alphaproteobacteria bacterium]|nr:tetratricopeptide repeat protein [Alphaproteobacteria bacterium]